MMFKNFPYISMMLLMLLSSLFIILSSSNWLFMWVGLELNLLCFMPLISSSNNMELEGMIKYFLTQASGSGILFTMIMYSFLFSTMNSMVLTGMVGALLLKLGSAPCHFWFPTVMNSLSWMNCFIISTLQKVGPLFILGVFMSSLDMLTFSLVIISNLMVGALGGINQTQIRPLLAYSSMVHLGWMVTLLVQSSSFMIIYMIMYMTILTSLLIMLSNVYMLGLNNNNFKNAESFKKVTMMFFSLLSLAGLPPLVGFLPKWMAIFIITRGTMSYLLLPLVIGSLLALFYYLNMFFMGVMNSMKSMSLNMMSPAQSQMIMVGSTTIAILLLNMN